MGTMMALPGEKGQQRAHRQRVIKGATILNGVKNSEISCSLRNMHKEGAELRVAADALVPQEFLLYVPVDGVAYRSVVRWRTGNRIGVQFVGTEPKPHWHYG